MDEHNELEIDDGIPPQEIKEVLAELGLELNLEQAAEVAKLLQTTGDVDEALAALDELMGDIDDWQTGPDFFREAA